MAKFGTLYGIGTLVGAVILPFIASHYDSTPLVIYTRRVFWALGVSALLFALTVHPIMLVMSIAGHRWRWAKGLTRILHEIGIA